MNWKPTVSIETLKARSDFLKSVRDFFYARDTYEVETPLMGHAPVTDPYLEAFEVLDKDQKNKFYLQTSPEYYMKRLLCAGSGSIFQICKAFRQEENGPYHLPEFTMLEWYKTNFTDDDLIQEVSDLTYYLFGKIKTTVLTYSEIFKHYLNLNPHTISDQNIKLFRDALKNHCPNIIGINYNTCDLNTACQLLISEIIEPKLFKDYKDDLIFIKDYPKSQAALAKLKIDKNNQTVAARFEVFYKGLELGNGYFECQNGEEQNQRFDQDLETRNKLGLKTVPKDNLLIDALNSQTGLPKCSGIAMGLDRLFLISQNLNNIQNSVAFPNN